VQKVTALRVWVKRQKVELAGIAIPWERPPGAGFHGFARTGAGVRHAGRRPRELYYRPPMDRIRVTGGPALRGAVRIAGAKNAALPAIAAAILTEEPIHLTNVPDVRDVTTMLRVLERIGAEWDAPNHGRREIALRRVTSHEAPFELVRTMRASVLVLGPLLARHGRARVSLPGGCAIGARPVNLHIEGLKRFGAEVRVEHGYIDAACERLTGAEFAFDVVSVTGTENLMMAACLARGTTVLRGAAAEPEVADLAALLVKMGARIEGAGTSVITIEGRERLGGAEHRIIPDRIEAGTYAVAAAITGGEVRLEGCEPSHMDAVFEHLARAGAEIRREARGVVVARTGALRAVDIETAPYPGFPTDMQAQWMALMTRADGTARIGERIFEGRFLHAVELQRMGADLIIEGRTVTARGPALLSGADVTASDLRASACLVLAGLVAQGATMVHRVYHLDRGYERMEEKLRPLGADIERIS